MSKAIKVLRVLLVSLILAVLALPILPGKVVRASSWWDAAWTERMVISFNATGISENLTNFAVRVELDSTNFDFSAAKDNGEDIRFIDADDATPLSFEFETWDKVGENAVFWVKIPKIDASSDYSDFFYLYWGNPVAAFAASPNDVWDANAVGVYHFQIGYNPLSPAVDTDTYDAFGSTIKNGADNVTYFYRSGLGHASGLGTLQMRRYVISTDTWSDNITLVTDAVYDVTRGASAGIINNNIFVFYNRYDTGAYVTFDNYYIKSTDLTGSSWGVPQVIDTPAYTQCNPYGNMIASGNGTYLMPYIAWTGGNYSNGFWASSNNGTTWELGPKSYEGVVTWNEFSYVNVGAGNIIGLARNDVDDLIGQVTSTDYGATWSAVSNTNIDAANNTTVWLYYDSSTDKLIFAYYDRSENISGLKVISVDKDTVFASSTSYPAADYIHIMTGADGGHPSIIETTPDNYMITYEIEDLGKRRLDYGYVTNADIYTATYPNTETYVGTPFNSTLSSTSYGLPGLAYQSVWSGGYQVFDGTDDFVAINDNDALDLDGDFTLEVWVTFDTMTSSDGLMSKIKTPAVAAWNFDWQRSANTLHAELYDGINNPQSDSAANSISANDTQYNCALEVDRGNTVSTFINGLLSGTPAVENTGIIINDLPLLIGKRGTPANQNWLGGKIDEVRIYNDLRTTEELEADEMNRLDTLLWYSEEENPEPSITTLPASNISMDKDGITAATVSGNLTSLGGTPDVKWWVEYGLTTGYGANTANTTANVTGVKSAVLPTILTPGATYHFRFVVQNVLGTTNGADESFAFTMPTVATGTATLAGSTVTLNGNISNAGVTSDSYIYLRYGTTPTLGSTTLLVVQAGVGSFSADVAAPGTDRTLYYQAVAQNGAVVSVGGVSSVSIPSATGGLILKALLRVVLAAAIIIGVLCIGASGGGVAMLLASVVGLIAFIIIDIFIGML